MPQIRGYHAHIYYDAGSLPAARTLCETVRDRFGADMGRMHERAVGPHPEWSCQLAFGPEKLGDILPWLALNRQGLTVFLHPDTGQELEDHRDRAIWMGSMPALKLEIFDR